MARLGAGGMGEVWLAHDDRLDRRVAVKRIHPEAPLTAERRERFRREARMAARINHPSVVQVYDVVEVEGAQHLVMEHVAGESLTRLLSRGRLPVPRALALGAEIAEGLAAAHAQGVVHRDLKAANVLVAADGRAKITDFGIARSLVGPAAEDGLTASHQVLGTSRSMSPEQARGLPVDHRSDLFSLGVLLYEALSGRSPFAADNTLATLRRIIEEPAPPLSELAPEVPEDVARFIEYLLQKDPELRPRNAREVAEALRAWATRSSVGETAAEETLGEARVPTQTPLGAAAPARPGSDPEAAHGEPGSVPPGPPDREPSALDSARVGRGRPRLLRLALALGLGAAGAAAYWLGRSPGEPLHVAVVRPAVEAEEADRDAADLAAEAVRAALLQALVGLDGISVRDPAEVDAAPGSAQAQAQALAADEVVSAALTHRPPSCAIALRRLAHDGRLLWTRSFEVPCDDLALASQAAGAYLRQAYAGRGVPAGPPGQEAGEAELAELLRLARRVEAAGAGPDEETLAALSALVGRAPRLLPALLLEAKALRRRFHDSHSDGDYGRARTLLARAAELAPEDPRPASEAFLLALGAARLDEAADELERLAALAPGDVLVEDRRADLLEAKGRSREAIAVLRAAARRRPAVQRLANLAMMEYRHGETAAARQHLEELLARSPGDLRATTHLAQLELLDGDLERAIDLYRHLADELGSPRDRSNLGLALMLAGRYAEAVDAFRRVHGDDPANPFFALNLADSLGLAGEPERAADLYREVVARIEQGGPADWHRLSVKAQALAHLERHREAVAALQAALKAAPDNNQVAWEAALVYTLVGERSSALVNAEAALSAGFGPRWFAFPWFDALRRDPAFQALVPG